ncbi:TraR/DksA C4-type zinc finger protein [Kiritimatiellota bacterium B12222]|nr:TraR/DksA C4-type zinc finger protein [Kiritimatiellota bacterium B12222]
MTNEDKAHLKKLLEQEIAAADQTIERLKEASQAVAPDNALGRLTRMETMGDQQMSKAKLSKMQQRRLELKNALGKLPNPSFGLCNACKNPLPVERLLAVPEACVCVPCLNKLQKKIQKR